LRPISKPVEWKKSWNDPNVEEEGVLFDAATRRSDARAADGETPCATQALRSLTVPIVSAPEMGRVLCRFLGHKLPRRRRPFFLTERFQRCERCGERVALPGRG